MCAKDRRGGNNPKRTDEREQIIEHIKLFPVKNTHYCRKDTNKRYLHEKLTIGKMHKLYEKWCKKKGIQSSETAHIHRGISDRV